MPTPALINRYARALLRSALAKGVDHDDLRSALGLGETQSLDTIEFGPHEFAALSRTIRLQLNDEFCGLARQPCKVGSFQLMCELLVTSETLAEALNRAFRFYGLLSDEILFTLEQQGPTATIVVTLAPPLQTHDFFYEWWLGLWRGLASWLIGEEVRATAVEFPHQPAVPMAEYIEAFCPACRFNQPRAALSFERQVLARPVIRNLDDLWDYFNNRPTFDLVAILGVQASLKSRLKAQLINRFSQTQRFPSMEEIAEQLHVSSQTLRRRLEEENYSYRALKEDIRREVVMKWLDNPDISIVEVSRMGGFAEPNGLTRAVKAWIGMSPKAYRSGLPRDHE